MRAQIYCRAADAEILFLLRQAAAGLKLVGENSPPEALLDPAVLDVESAIIILHLDRGTAQTLQGQVDDPCASDRLLRLLKRHHLIIVAPEDVRRDLEPVLAYLSQEVDLSTVSYEPKALVGSLSGVIMALESARTILLADPGRYIRMALEARPTLLGYDIQSQHKVVTIYPIGYGIVEFTTEIAVTSASFEGPVHYFGLNDFVPPDVRLPPVDELAMADPSFRGLRPMFNYRLLAPRARLSTGSVVAHEIAAESTDRMRVVQFRFMPRPRLNEVLKYAWEWAFPGLFQTIGEDSSGFRCIRDFWDFSIEIRFVHPGPGAYTAFATGGEPTLHVLGLGDELAVLPALGVDEVGYRSYTWKLTKGIAGNQYIVRWTLCSPLKVDPPSHAIGDAPACEQV